MIWGTFVEFFVNTDITPTDGTYLPMLPSATAIFKGSRIAAQE